MKFLSFLSGSNNCGGVAEASVHESGKGVGGRVARDQGPT